MSGVLVLTNAKETCRYDEVSGKFLLGGATSGSQPISVALAQSAKTIAVDGMPCEVTVRYIDQTFSTRFETLHGVYNSADNSISRTLTVASTTGTGAISFDPGTGPDNLVIYGTTSHAINGVQILQDEEFFDGTDSAITATTLQPIGQEYTVTPAVSNNSFLQYFIRTDTRMAGTNSVDDLRGRVAVQYQDNSGVWNTTGLSYFIGHVNISAASTSPVVYAPLVMSGTLTSALKNSSGDWQLRLAGEVDFADNTLQNFSTYWQVQEKVRY